MKCRTIYIEKQKKHQIIAREIEKSLANIDTIIHDAIVTFGCGNRSTASIFKNEVALYFKIISDTEDDNTNITIEETITNDRFVTADEEEAIFYIRQKIMNLVHPED